MLISEYDGLRKNVFLRDVVKALATGIVSNDRLHASALALNHSVNNGLVAFGVLNILAPSTADISFVHLHRRSLQLHILREQHTNLLKHAPRGFISDASLTLDLLCGDSATSGTHQVHCLKPSAKRSSAFLENSSGKRIDVM